MLHYQTRILRIERCNIFYLITSALEFTLSIYVFQYPFLFDPTLSISPFRFNKAISLEIVLGDFPVISANSEFVA